jgi:hypothetical protein
MLLKAEVVEQPLRRRLHPHHRPVSLDNPSGNGITPSSRNQPPLNQQNRHEGDAPRLLHVGLPIAALPTLGVECRSPGAFQTRCHGALRVGS